MAALDHVHMYVRFKDDKNPVKRYFKCSHPDCTTVQNAAFLCGKRSLCNVCGSEMILTYEQLRNKKPRCENCSQSKTAIQKREMKSQLTDELTLLFKKEDNHDFDSLVGAGISKELTERNDS